MKITTWIDTDGTDSIILDFSNQRSCKLNNLQLDSLKEWLNKYWNDGSLRGGEP